MSITTKFKGFLSDLQYAGRLVMKPSIHVYEGVTVPVVATPHLRAVRGLIYRGAYEREEMDCISSLVRPDDIVVEFGAGCGIISAFVGRRLKSSKQLHIFEANPSLVESIEAVCAANGLTPEIEVAAVANCDGEMEFNIHDHFLSSSSVERAGTSRKVKVKSVSAARVLNNIQPTLLIFDIEGAENVLSSIELPPSVRAICCEVHPHIIGGTGVSQLVANFLAQGFVIEVDLCIGRTMSFRRPYPTATEERNTERRFLHAVT